MGWKGKFRHRMHVDFKMISIDPGTDTLFKKIDIQVRSLGKMRELEIWGVIREWVVADIMLLTEVF